MLVWGYTGQFVPDIQKPLGLNQGASTLLNMSVKNGTDLRIGSILLYA